MGVTISTHNGSQVAREHNLRNEKVVSKEAHINTKGEHETWIDENPREAYERIFGKAVADYNAKQTREDRKIKSYYNEVGKDAKKHQVYEMIIGVYGKDENGCDICSEAEGKRIMQEFVKGWQERNPNLELIGAYYHNDEASPHVHLDYIPVGHGYSRGMETQNGLVQAFKEMGIEKQGKATAQIQWEARENKVLENICVEHGLEVVHPKEEHREHIATEQYKAQKALESTIDNTIELEAIKDKTKADIGKLEAQRDKANKQAQKALERKAKALDKSFKKDKDSGWTYNKGLEKELKQAVKDMKEDVAEISHTDLDITLQFEQAEKYRKEKQKEAYAIKEKAEAEAREKLEKGDKYISQAKEYQDKQADYILGTADKKVEKFLRERFHGEDSRFEDLCEFLKKFQGGENVLNKFHEWEKEQEEALEKSWHMSR